MNIQHFFDTTTSTLTYVGWDPETCDAVIIDPVLNYEPGSSYYNLSAIHEIQNFVQTKNLTIHSVIETHAHADHLSGANELKNIFPTLKILIGKNIVDVQKIFKDVFNFGSTFATDGSQFDQLVADGENFSAGSLKFKVIHTPGHTPACNCFLIGDAVFTGDTLFMPDFGVARCDFPGGSASQLFHSVKNKLYTLPDATRIFTAHDYQPGGRPLRWQSTIGESKRNNIHINESTRLDEFVDFREARDKTLSPPKLLLPSLEVNLMAGQLPPPESNGVRYLKIPIRKGQ